MATTVEEPKITLHWLNGSRAQSVLWLMEELQVPYELKTYHRRKNATAPPELEKIHPLGHSPVITVGDRAIAESGFVMQYLCDHFGAGKTLVPARWQAGREGKLGGETEEWMRYQYLLYYSEGSLMPYLLIHLIFNRLKGPDIPWLIRPITRAVAGQVTSALTYPKMKKHLTMLEGMLSSSPSNGKYICGPKLTTADIMLSYPLIASKDSWNDLGQWDKGTARETFPKVFAYVEGLQTEPGWKTAVDKIVKLEGEFLQSPK